MIILSRTFELLYTFRDFFFLILLIRTWMCSEQSVLFFIQIQMKKKENFFLIFIYKKLG